MVVNSCQAQVKSWNDLGFGRRLGDPSPDGFNWGYGGSGPAELARAILPKLCPKEIALFHYGLFKREVIARLPEADFEEQLTFVMPA